MTDARLVSLAPLVAFGCALVVMLRVATAPAAPPKRVATPAEQKQIADSVAADEWNWTRDTTRNFPSDRWSQRDDFHSVESRRLQELARQKGIRIEDAIRAVDDDIHRRNARGDAAPDGRNARAVPCKPRPFYD